MIASRQLFACFFARVAAAVDDPITKDDLRACFGATRATLDNWVAGRVRVPLPVVLDLCRVTGMAPGVWVLALAAQHGAEDGIGRDAFPTLWADIDRLGGLPPADPLEPSAVKAGRFIYADGEILNRDPAHMRDDAGDGWGDRRGESEARP